MKVYRHPPRHEHEEQLFHVVERTGYITGLEKSLLTFQVHAVCDRKFLWDNKKIKYGLDEYKKTHHRKKLCEECVRLVKIRIANRKR